METTIGGKNSAIRTWLFNPFHYVAGVQSLVVGAAVLAVTSLIGSLSRSHFDGVIDFHTGLRAPLWFSVAEGFLSWIAMAATVCVAGLILSKTRFRILDVFGTQALARAPHLVTSLAALLPGYESFSSLVAAQPLDFLEVARREPGGFASFLVVMIVTIAMTVWMVYLMYRAFSVSCNVSGGKAVIVFIAALLAAEILSKILVVKAAALCFR